MPDRQRDVGCLSVVVPCFNEVDHIAECIARVLDEPCVREVLVVDDGSVDGTAEVLTNLRDPRIHVYTHRQNRGKGAALRTGFAAVTGEFVVVQDSDLEQNPSDYELMLAPLLTGQAAVVYGSRFPERRRLPGQYIAHYLANRFLTMLSNLRTGLQITDMETGYKMFRREVLDGLTIEEDRFGVEPELTAKIARAGWRLVEIPVTYAPRKFNTGKKIGWRDGVRAVWCIYRYPRRQRFGRRDCQS